MNNGQLKEYVNWLTSALETQKDAIARLFLRLRDIGARAGTSLALHKKFIRLMQQVAQDHEKERAIIHEIEAVEKRHREMRQRKLLRQIDPDAPSKGQPAIEAEDLPKPRRLSLWVVVGVMALFARPRKDKGEEPQVR